MEIILFIRSDHNGKEYKSTVKETSENAQNHGRLNNMLLNDKWVLEGIYRRN